MKVCRCRTKVCRCRAKVRRCRDISLVNVDGGWFHQPDFVGFVSFFNFLLLFLFSKCQIWIKRI